MRWISGTRPFLLTCVALSAAAHEAAAHGMRSPFSVSVAAEVADQQKRTAKAADEDAVQSGRSLSAEAVRERGQDEALAAGPSPERGGRCPRSYIPPTKREVEEQFEKWQDDVYYTILWTHNRTTR